jgi:CelD/BcsL family acetyltransferase involved in cellulose biosynthesis
LITETQQTLPGLAGCSIPVHQIHPLDDPRWIELIARHPRSSVFQSPQWLRALQLTYGYEPLVLSTSSPNGPLNNGFVACRIESWVTGRRIVSLPFSDHCEPLMDGAEELQAVFSSLEQQVRDGGLSYIEMRSVKAPELTSTLPWSRQSYYSHLLDLGPDLPTLFHNCHKDSIQRKIRRAEREHLTHEAGRSDALLEAFCRLYVATRRRHRVPPQPRAWFKNLIHCFGEQVEISIASKEGLPIAGILTLRHKDTLVYKYGCSDTRYNNLGGNHLLFWRMIEEAKGEGLRWLDLGRTDLENPGLATFKSRWGAVRSTLTYSRFARSQSSIAHYKPGADSWKERVAKGVIERLPDEALFLLGRVLYRHVG